MILEKFSRKKFSFLLGLVIVLIAKMSYAAQSIAVQGRLLNADGTAVTSPSVQFTVKVKSPGAEDCLLYQETQILDLSRTAGAFVITLGSGTRAAANVDGGNPLNAVFSNSSAISLTTAPTACANAATSFTPSTADTRNLEITFNDGSGADSIPTIPLAWTPQSIYSQDSGKLAGVNGTQYLKVATGTVPTTLSTVDYSNLAALLAGTSTQYMSSNATAGTVVPNLGLAPVAPSAGQMWFDSVSGTMKYYNGTVTQTFGTSAGISSVGITMPAIFSVSGSPLTANGSITTTLANQSANTVLAGPSLGGAATPAFRALAATDLPIAAAGGVIKDGGNSLGAAMTIGTNDANTIGLKTNNSTRMSIDTSGNVGIGTTFPLANFDLVGTSRIGNIGPTSATTLSGAVLAADTAINVVSTTGYPSSGVLYITDTTTFEEAVSYSGTTATSFTGLTRGLYATTARTWAIGNTVDLVTQVVSGANNTVAPRVFYTQTRGMGYGRVPAAWSGTGSQYSSTLMTGSGMQISTANAGVSWGTSSTNVLGQGTSATTDFVRIVTNFNEKMRIDASGNVGINNLAPRGPLEVNRIPNTRLTTSINSAVTTMQVSANTFPASGTLIIDSEQMTYTGGGTTTFTITRAANSTVAASHFSGTAISYYASSSLIVTSAGNVGVGTSTPSTALTIGSGQITTPYGTSAAPAYSFSNDPTTGITGSAGVLVISVGGATGLYINSSGFRFASGRNFADSFSGNAFLKFTNTNLVSNSSTNHIEVVNGPSGSAPELKTTGPDSNINLLLSPKGTGNVGIGNSSPGYKLDVAGDINTSTCFRLRSGTTVGGTCTSDERLKEDIQDYNGGLSDLLNIRLRTYKFNGLGEMRKSEEVAVGVIAQEVEKTNPELVKTRKVKMHPDDKEKTEIKVVDYSKFSYMLINAVKELYQKWFADHGRIELLETQVRSLTSEIEKKVQLIEALKSSSDAIKDDNELLKAYLCQKDPAASICR